MNPGSDSASAVFRPSRESQIVDFLAGCAETGSSVEIQGGGTKRALGRPMAGEPAVLDMRGLAGITLYEPAELVLTAQAGTPLSEIENAVREHGQCLAFEPPDLSGLFGTAGKPTLGGIVATGLSGPRRIKVGAVRDHVLGALAVGGDGKRFKSGGRVVKNVTGFDLPKLLTGSYGTLAALTEITIKVLPTPEAARTLLVLGLEPELAIRLLSEALGGPYDVSGAAHVPAATARRAAMPGGGDASVTAFRIEGFGPSVDDRFGALKARIAPRAGTQDLSGDTAASFWRDLRDVAPLIDPGRTVWRLSLPPSDAAATVAAIARGVPTEALYDWGGGLVWLAMPDAPDGHAPLVRSCLPSGHATLMRAPETVRANAPVFQPLPSALGELTRRVKQAFDPRAILNPGRMYTGI